MKEPKNRLESQTKSFGLSYVSVADVIASIGAEPDLKPLRRRDMRSALRTLCRVLEREPEQVPAYMPMLAEALARVNLVDARITQKRLANVKSDVMAAFRLIGISQSPKHRYPPMTEAWKQLRYRCARRQRTGLSRFINVCSMWSIEPGAVDDKVVARYIDALPYLAFMTDKQVRDSHRRVTRLWNECGATIDGWPATRLVVPGYRRPLKRLPLSDYPASFQQDVSYHIVWLSDPDPFAEYRPPRSYKAASRRLRQNHILSAASAFIDAGGEASDLSRLADLVKPEHAKMLLRTIHKTGGESFGSYDRGVMKALIHIARYWVRADVAQIQALKELQKLMGSEHCGMTPKNRATLLALEDPKKEARLLFLPDDLVEEATRCDRGDRRSALVMQTAAALGILCIAPIRIGNLIAVEFDRHLIRPAGPNGNWCLKLSAEEVKNDVEVDFVLSAEVSAMIDLYRERFRSRLAIGGGDFLFPNSTGGHKNQNTLALQIEKAIKARVGIDMTPHQFRHFAAQQMLSGDEPADLPRCSNCSATRAVRRRSISMAGTARAVRR